MKSVTIGIYFDGEVGRLAATLAGLRAHTGFPFHLVLLPDALPPCHRNELATRGIDLPAVEGSVAGVAACFNRLAACDNSEAVIFLEAGAVPGPHWIELLLGALEADPMNGLAGPSTNSAWNEQGTMRGGGSLLEVAAIARTAEARFGKVWKSLEPLHSLSDFCYVVKRQVIAAIGGADEQYGTGPCWEMDYNIRAARHGYRGVWACGAYVYRAPFSSRRAREEPLRLESSKRRYQDKFCGRRLRGGADPYKSHCRGDQCEHFAPPQLIQVGLPLTPLATTTVPAGFSYLADAGRVPGALCERPLISCLMVTGKRRDFALQSIRYFDRQDFADRELIVVDDGPEDLAAEVASNPRVRYVRVQPGMTIGAKRNRACEYARGAIIAQWDDDDWYGNARLTAQVQPILAGIADITGLTDSLFFDLPRWQFWSCSKALHQRLFVEDVHGGTLTYRREVWEKDHYPNASLAEDAALLRAALRRGARLHRIPSGGLFLYLRHAGNTWSFDCGQAVDPTGWHATDQPELGEDLAFYQAHTSSNPSRAMAAQPLVSCIMPTANRRAFVPQAIRYFQRQTYANRELIVLDDGSDAVQDLIPPDPVIRYHRLPARHALGAKRNMACEMARGEVILHWDDDDWMAERRIAYQVAALANRPQPSVCGLSSLYFCHLHGDRAWLYVYPDNGRPWVAGGTLCYRKELWRQHRFHEIDDGEDTRFVSSLPAGAVVPLADNRFYVATVHDANTSPKRTADSRWQARPVAEIQGLLGDCWQSFLGQVGRASACPR
jgi:O-antigen biosynthesis protein